MPFGDNIVSALTSVEYIGRRLAPRATDHLEPLALSFPPMPNVTVLNSHGNPSTMSLSDDTIQKLAYNAYVYPCHFTCWYLIWVYCSWFEALIILPLMGTCFLT